MSALSVFKVKQSFTVVKKMWSHFFLVFFPLPFHEMRANSVNNEVQKYVAGNMSFTSNGKR